MFPKNPRLTAQLIAFIAIMCATSNVFGLITIPIGITSIHLIQLPIILTGLALGAVAGGLVGFLGAMVMAFSLLPPNPYILLGNAILGFLTGLIYGRLRPARGSRFLYRVIAVVGAIALQFPYVYISDVYLASMPVGVVQTIILPKLLLEDLISVFLSHLILFRIDIAEKLK